jgi:uncharacterized membrane protein
MSGRRMEAFSDGVIAILITIMVLELHQPSGPSFADLRGTYPSLLAYVLSFVYLGIYWNNHHHLLMTVRKVTGAMLWANLALLFSLSLFPFATAWMSENGFATDTVATYAVVVAMAAATFTVLQIVIVRSHGTDLRLKNALGRDLKAKLSFSAYLAAIPLAFVFRWLSIGIFIAVAATWFIPDRRLQNYVESTSDALEAD